MAATARGHSSVRRRSPFSRLAAIVAALAFVLQSLILQTHIHDGALEIDGIASVAAFATKPAHGTSPIDSGPLDCAVCHLIAHAGVFFTIASSILIPPVKWAELAAPSIVIRAVTAVAILSWRSRAPPLR